MTTEETNNTVILLIAHSQCMLHLLDQFDFKGMNDNVARIFKDSKDIFKVVNSHLFKKFGMLYEEVYKVDPDTIDTLIEALEHKVNELKELEIKDIVIIK